MGQSDDHKVHIAPDQASVRPEALLVPCHPELPTARAKSPNSPEITEITEITEIPEITEITA